MPAAQGRAGAAANNLRVELEVEVGSPRAAQVATEDARREEGCNPQAVLEVVVERATGAGDGMVAETRPKMAVSVAMVAAEVAVKESGRPRRQSQQCGRLTKQGLSCRHCFHHADSSSIPKVASWRRDS